jgi:hypothetical protein
MLLFQLLLLNLLQLLWAVVGSTRALPLIIQLVLEGQRSSSGARILLFPRRSVLVEGWRRRQLAMTNKRRLATLTTAASATQVVTYVGACGGKPVPLLLLIAIVVMVGGGVLLTAGRRRTAGRLLLSMNRAGPRLRTAAGGRGWIIGVSALAHFLCVHLLRPEVVRLAAAQLTYTGLWPRRLGGSAPSWHLVGRLLPAVASSRCCDRRSMALCMGHHRVASFVLEKVSRMWARYACCLLLWMLMAARMVLVLTGPATMLPIGRRGHLRHRSGEILGQKVVCWLGRRRMNVAKGWDRN